MLLRPYIFTFSKDQKNPATSFLLTLLLLLVFITYSNVMNRCEDCLEPVKPVACGSQTLPPSQRRAIANAFFTLEKRRKRRMILQSLATKELGDFHLDLEPVRKQVGRKAGELSHICHLFEVQQRSPRTNDPVRMKHLL